jgi:hypothetical protein
VLALVLAGAGDAARPPWYVPTAVIRAVIKKQGLTATVAGHRYHTAVRHVICVGRGTDRAGRFHRFNCHVKTKNGTTEIEVTAFGARSKWFYSWTFG